MNPGVLNKRIRVQTQDLGQDEYGQPVTRWTDSYSCWAAINVKDSKQLFSTAEFVAKVTLNIMVRWTSSFRFQPSQRVVYVDPLGTHVYNIESISNPDQANKTVTLTVFELDGSE